MWYTIHFQFKCGHSFPPSQQLCNAVTSSSNDSDQFSGLTNSICILSCTQYVNGEMCTHCKLSTTNAKSGCLGRSANGCNRIEQSQTFSWPGYLLWLEKKKSNNLKINLVYVLTAHSYMIKMIIKDIQRRLWIW